MITTTSELLNRLQHLPIFKGVYAKDLIPQNIYNGVVIVNTDDSTAAGSHWVAIQFCTSDNMVQGNYFFDSYALHPEIYGIHIANLVGWNEQQLQGLRSTVCGYYCMYYVIMRQQRVPMKRLLQQFSTTNFDYNDSLIVKLVDKYKTVWQTNARRTLYLSPICNQICRSRALNLL